MALGFAWAWFAAFVAARYLDPTAPGGAVWNIYLHCLDPRRWPIYDQHAHRAMVWLQEGRIVDLPVHATRAAKAAIYASYQERYLPFLRTHFVETDLRRIDRALFSFGRLLFVVRCDNGLRQDFHHSEHIGTASP